MTDKNIIINVATDGTIIVCVDMDGTIADYAAKELEDFYEDGYFINLQPYETLLNFLRNIATVIDIYIISACITEKAKIEKGLWLDKYFPEIPKNRRIFMPCGESKAKYMENIFEHKLGKNIILLDDYTPNCLDWEENGGTAIKVFNGINCSGKTWKGLTINAYAPKSSRKEKKR